MLYLMCYLQKHSIFINLIKSNSALYQHNTFMGVQSSVSKDLFSFLYLSNANEKDY